VLSTRCAQRALGIPDAPEIFEADTLKSAAKDARPPLIRVLTHESGPAIDWLMDAFDLDLTVVSRLAAHTHPRTHRGKDGNSRCVAACVRAAATRCIGARVVPSVVARCADPPDADDAETHAGRLWCRCAHWRVECRARVCRRFVWRVCLCLRAGRLFYRHVACRSGC
jgi:hypothetical protein